MSTLQHVPVIDLEAFRNGSDPESVSRQVDQALRDIGFLVVSGHGVAREITDTLRSVSREFFNLPVERKLALHNTVDGAFRGYVAEGDETFSYTIDATSAHDLKESFVMGQFAVTDSAYYTTGPASHAFAPNAYPADLPELQPAYEAYYRSMETLVETLMRIFAAALKLPDDYFYNKFDRHASTLRATNYPHQTKTPLQGQLRAGEHTDYGAVTILAIEDKPGGLEVRTTSGDWIAVPTVTDTFVVNIGDLMMNWTNDYWLSNMHRVANPPMDAELSTRRQSIVYFANPNYDALIECLPGRLAPGEAAKYPPVTAGDHRLMKIRKSAQVAEASD